MTSIHIYTESVEYWQQQSQIRQWMKLVVHDDDMNQAKTNQVVWQRLRPVVDGCSRRKTLILFWTQQIHNTRMYTQPVFNNQTITLCGFWDVRAYGQVKLIAIVYTSPGPSYCNVSLSPFVCQRLYLRNHMAKLHQFIHVACCDGLVVLWRRCQ